jgi:hypothetical protein
MSWYRNCLKNKLMAGVIALARGRLKNSKQSQHIFQP